MPKYINLDDLNKALDDNDADVLEYDEDSWWNKYGYSRSLLDKIVSSIETCSFNTGKWEHVSGYVTPGGDPVYGCPFCKDKKSHHVNGIENHNEWGFCPCCGAELKYW